MPAITYDIKASNVRMTRSMIDICVSQNGDTRPGKRIVARRTVKGYTFEYDGRLYGVHSEPRTRGAGRFWVVTDLASGLQICAGNTRHYAVESFLNLLYDKTMRAVGTSVYLELVKEFEAAAPYVEG